VLNLYIACSLTVARLLGNWCK